ncbi:MAG: MerR family transcriptional regulator [Nocardiopsaceae bacterium]|jgi:MerR family mercuric resistance operon transcriptional regulator|nr:MerR family transcriptional regulator [Nocardiopsaceae bacterium]
MTLRHEMREHATSPARRLRSGEVASAAGVNVQTLRYYERRGLLAQPGRNAAGHRQYPPHTITLLRMIRSAQRLGLSLDEIAGIITAAPDSDSISPLARRRVAEIDAEIAQLTAIREVLAGYIR